MKTETPDFKLLARRMRKQLIAWRRQFHRYPELGFQEFRTAETAARILERLGGRVRRGVGKTGVLADFGLPAGQGPCIALRADMDALPIQEANPVPYASRRKGVMHACGHDAHVAMALGAAALLSKFSDLPGTVRILIQPCEETNDSEGLSGAGRMLADGALEGVDLILAQHVAPGTPTGQIRLEAGPASGGVDSFFGRILGAGGHGAYPHQALDPFVLSAHVIIALNSIVSRRLDPIQPAVVSLGTLHGGLAENVIPAHVDLAGSLRYSDPQIQQQIHTEIKRAFELARTLGGDYELRFDLGTPPMINHPQAVDLLRRSASQIIGEANILLLRKDLGAEDFGVFSAQIPGTMFSLGVRLEDEPRRLHSPTFDLDENALEIGTAIMAQAAWEHLHRNRATNS